jgi:hypothetical protein
MRRIMYIENKMGGLDGKGRIGWVEMSRTARSYQYRGRRLQKTESGYKFNCIHEESGDIYWVSGPSKNGTDKLYGGIVSVDEDARIEYWTKIRNQPESVHLYEYRSGGTTRTQGRSRGGDMGMRASSKA